MALWAGRWQRRCSLGHFSCHARQCSQCEVLPGSTRAINNPMSLRCVSVKVWALCCVVCLCIISLCVMHSGVHSHTFSMHNQHPPHPPSLVIRPPSFLSFRCSSNLSKSVSRHFFIYPLGFHIQGLKSLLLFTSLSSLLAVHQETLNVRLGGESNAN